MARILSKVVATTATVAALALPPYPAYAAGHYDGVWVINLPPNGETDQHDYACPAVSFEIRITDNQVSGELHRVGRGTDVVSGASGSSSAPITGNVSPDGMLHTDWSGYHASAQLTGDKGTISAQRTCGPETGTIARETN